jgi:hypothetical protein
MWYIYTVEYYLAIRKMKPGIVAHTGNPHSREAKAEIQRAFPFPSVSQPIYIFFK